MLDKLKLDYGLDFRGNQSLAEFTTFKIGGPAKYFVEVGNRVDLQKALQAAVDNKLKYFIIGGGSNLLVSDDGIDGLVILLRGEKTEINGSEIQVFAGNNWPKFVQFTINSGYEGLEFSGNIPGTVGGAVRGNAGAYGKGVGDFVKEVEVLVVNDKEVSLKILNKQECEFEYRESIFKKNLNYVVAEVVFTLPKTGRSKELQQKEIAEEAKMRCGKQPLKYPSAGCSFKNVIFSDQMLQYKGWETHGKIAAGKFIEEAGLKGKQIGGAKISDEHANFIVNTGNATASDVVQLISLIKMKVRDEFGVQLEEEVQYVGF
ncbi:UDP-N-acetylenolpyruvoylglucosamine reductase [Candidatus Falkowbacteria bacterium RIFOXYD2_FULL_35_9]|uniref:UDP-N-acetylenolpyruvoylglucosamine reductase n=1 Tax=Candidatus Falkowbacteria bacterium RIFOXYC2_FULL_36_12 TaxID=1798002 RepID=A0A1F5T006_9BACT|nr:MAG: UDP-N-acetylenolpyruvoylglucosamine reductase [Candidatus Falkowbacteria bacterium RIFOXYB2_FULL_35_7]OGF32278.1 MAG: UDP-N-acetylenolpyruvoylglucosamine reductase [Candidatus Falkowbacteria bacterium RIFOXYC2_FULL_36_12]OGF47957.1 MAG: UDP-N-acetylenolpyruvoylglucosamine reductase [Candidatus Falkowbacteria bacterium RIFOXYD2_FULL_35_9]